MIIRPPMASYDAVVIGAGHNGLTCACYLADRTEARVGRTPLRTE